MGKTTFCKAIAPLLKDCSIGYGSASSDEARGKAMEKLRKSNPEASEDDIFEHSRV